MSTKGIVSNFEDVDLVPPNVKDTINIFGVTGNFIGNGGLVSNLNGNYILGPRNDFTYRYDANTIASGVYEDIDYIYMINLFVRSENTYGNARVRVGYLKKDGTLAYTEQEQDITTNRESPAIVRIKEDTGIISITIEEQPGTFSHCDFDMSTKVLSSAVAGDINTGNNSSSFILYNGVKYSPFNINVFGYSFSSGTGYSGYISGLKLTV